MTAAYMWTRIPSLLAGLRVSAAWHHLTFISYEPDELSQWLFHDDSTINIITGWAVALNCYISHSAKHRKITDFDPSGSQNP